ncbi:MAG: mandelate racemase/muconate lactonizing enzyme family protein, partial [Candidatus Latescibacteria bacterium]|nr:mandelate racemase/muconate lactonizing enzyme family protein [Candidatus Latescibacterota bacterium]
MVITEVRTIPLFGETPDTGWSQGTDPSDNMHTLIEIETDGGLTGLGSCFTSQALVDGALGLLRPNLIGESALEPERVAEKLHQMTFWQGRGGSVTHAISGVDIALWDLLGKACGQPVGRLLGGCYRDRIKPYGSLLFDSDEDAQKCALHDAMEHGFRAFKLGWGPFGRVDRQTDERLVRLARETVGPDVELMVDAGGSEQFWPHGYKWALETARMLVDHDITWFEEALPPDDIEGYIRLREHAPLPIASGEVFTRRQSFFPWIERGALDIVQPDATKVGGISEVRRITWSAYDHNILLVTHGWNTAIGLAADLHLAAANPTARWVEYITPSPYIEEIITTPFALDNDGLLAIPQ